MSHSGTSILTIGEFRVEPTLGEISRGGTRVRLEPRAMQLLVYLAEKPGEVVSVNQLLDAVWKNLAVAPDSVYQTVAALRRALGDSAKTPAYIANVVRRGYRLIAPVTRGRPGTDSDASAEPMALRISTPVLVLDKSVAVLPFVDMSALHDQEYFADGLVEEILHLLFKVPTLKLAARTSAFHFKGRSDDVRAIGAKLGVAYIVEGSVRRLNDHLRVTAQLIDTRTGLHRWSATYDQDVGDVLRIQSEIATAVARSVQLEIHSFAKPHADFGSRLYLRGLHAEGRFDQMGFEEAVNCYKHALALDPTFVPAAEALARALKGRAHWGFAHPQTAWQGVRDATERALRLEPHSAIAHAILSRVHSEHDWDWSASANEAETAVALAPSDPDVLTSAAIARLALGEFSQAGDLLDMACTCDPLNADTHNIMGWVYVRLGRFADAECASRRAVELSSTCVWAHHDLGVTLLCQGRHEEALDEMNREPHPGGRLSGIAIAYHALQRSAESDAALSTLVSQYADEMALKIAEAHAFRGDRDQAIKWLERAYRQRDFDLYCVKGNWLLTQVQGDPRYTDLLRKMELR
jgi:TolB-like protein/tetratricopeptide (TPR) repeat protein